MSRDFYELCYNQYKQEHADADSLYQKAGILLLVFPLLVTIMVKIGRQDIIRLVFIRIDVFFFYLAIVAGCLTVVGGVAFLFWSIYPRSKYKNIASMDHWLKWRQDYLKWLKDKKEKTESENEDATDLALFENINPLLAEAQSANSTLNEKRRKAFQRSVLMAAIALIFVGVQAVFYLILKLQGV